MPFFPWSVRARASQNHDIKLARCRNCHNPTLWPLPIDTLTTFRMGLADLFADVISSLGFAEAQAEAPPAETQDNEEKPSEEPEQAEESEPEEEEEQEVEDVKPKLEEGESPSTFFHARPHFAHSRSVLFN